MKTLLQNCRGSVMMEFILVFPIYLVLMAALFAVGDMLVHSIRLPSAERTAAFDLGTYELSPGWGTARTWLFPSSELSDSKDEQGNFQRQNQPVLAKLLQHHDYGTTLIQGPWSALVGTKVRNDYFLPFGGTAGQLAFSDWFFTDRTGQASADSDGSFQGLIWGRQRMPMFSKDERTDRTYAYNYYTLRRQRYNSIPFRDRYASNSFQGWRDNTRPAADLLCAVDDGREHWREVANEGWHDRKSYADYSGVSTPKLPSIKTTIGPLQYQRNTFFVGVSD